jgi:hypothetical protein
MSPAPTISVQNPEVLSTVTKSFYATMWKGLGSVNWHIPEILIILIIVLTIFSFWFYMNFVRSEV